MIGMTIFFNLDLRAEIKEKKLYFVSYSQIVEMNKPSTALRPSGANLIFRLSSSSLMFFGDTVTLAPANGTLKVTS